MSDSPMVIDDKAGSRFALTVDGHEAELLYSVEGKRLELIHTEVPAELGGRGLGGVLVEAALDRAAAEGLTVVPYCPFARSWLQRHPDRIGNVPVEYPNGNAGH